MPFETPFQAMQAAVDVVMTSEHPSNKVAAAIFKDSVGIEKVNYWPAPIVRAFGREVDIGNSSGTIHAETACILSAPFSTEGASLAITDPFCPNCAKNIAEAGVKKIYIDHKGFDKDFFQRRGNHFDTMSMRVCEKAGIAVYELWRKDERTNAIFEPHAGYRPKEDSPIHTEPAQATEAALKDIIAQAFKIHKGRRFVVAIVKDANDVTLAMTVRGHVVTGFSMQSADDIGMLEARDLKYSFFQEPVNRALMHMARHGMKPLPGFFFSSIVPTSREQVNLAGAGMDAIIVGDITKSRDADGMVAMRQLSNAGIMKYL
jgi:dCMP deaminase